MAILIPMSSEMREKQALVVFALLIVLGMSGLIWYLFAGHSWNVTASNIDDSVGQMEGYTAILYAGTMTEETSASSKSSALTDSLKAGVGESSNMVQDSSSVAKIESGAVDEARSSQAGEVALPQEELHEEKTSASVSADSTSDRQSVQTESASRTETADTVAESASRTETADASADSASELSGERSTSSQDDSRMTGSDQNVLQGSSSKNLKKSVSVDEVRDSYVDKCAGVLVLDLYQPENYSEGTIVKRGERRIGVISITRPLNEVLAKRILAPFQEAKVDMVVCIAPEKSYLADISGFDIVVCTGDDSVSVIGETSNKTFFVNAPSVGCVGATVVSPSNVVSAKVIDSL